MQGVSYLYWVEEGKAYPVVETAGLTDGCVRMVKIEIPEEKRTEDRDLNFNVGYLVVQNKGSSFFDERGIRVSWGKGELRS